MAASVGLRTRTTDEVFSRLKLRHLTLLVEVAARGNIVHAASSLNVAQPAATKIIRNLEAALGRRLFQRISHGVVPTHYGEVVVRRARRILGEVHHTGEELQALSQGMTGHVTVGTLLAAAPSLLPHGIVALKRERPEISFSLVEDSNEKLMAMLRLGDLDCVVGYLSGRAPEADLVQEILCHEPVAITVRRDHPLAGKAVVTLDDLQAQQWIMPPAETALRRQLELCFRSAGRALPREAVESISILANFSMLKATDMVAALPCNVVDTQPDLCRLPIDFVIGSGAIGVTRRAAADITPAADHFLHLLKSVARQREAQTRH